MQGEWDKWVKISANGWQRSLAGHNVEGRWAPQITLNVDSSGLEGDPYCGVAYFRRTLIVGISAEDLDLERAKLLTERSAIQWFSGRAKEVQGFKCAGGCAVRHRDDDHG